METNPIKMLRKLKDKMYADFYSGFESGEDIGRYMSRVTKPLKYGTAALAIGLGGRMIYDIVSGNYQNVAQIAKDATLPVIFSLFSYHFHDAGKIFSAISKREQGHKFSDQEKKKIKSAAKIGRFSHLAGFGCTVGYLSLELLDPILVLFGAIWFSYVGYAAYGAIYDAASDFAIGKKKSSLPE
jgi:hypothetical protein